MPLTRHLYEMDEVVSALQTCLYNNWPRAQFWLWELVRSDEAEIAYDTLIDAWLRLGGGHDPTLLATPQPALDDTTGWCRLLIRIQNARRTAKTLNAERLLNAIATMDNSPRTAEAPLCLNNPRAAPFLKVLQETEELTQEEGRHLFAAFEAALSYDEAMWLLQAIQPVLSADTIWTLIDGLLPLLPPCIRTTATADPIRQLLHQAAAIMLQCMSSDRRAEALTPQNPDPWSHERDWVRWDANLDRRAGRHHEIPAAALHKGTARGAIPSRYTNITDVRDPVPLLGEGCRWWRTALASAGVTVDEEAGTLEFPDDDTLEAFYARHFPDDIPDEWSTRDQQKSHGRGCAEKAPPALSIALRETRLSDAAWIAGIQLSGC
jgi:hypothetical protein